jgi:opacity protein-like surface antigen
MKKNILMIAGCAMLLSISSSAYSAEGPYVSGNLGLAIASDSDMTNSTAPGITLDIQSDMGWAVGGAVGYGFSNNTRIEGEIAYQKNDLDKMGILGIDFPITGDTSSLALLLNGYYDFVNNSSFTPFISGGIGYAKVDISDTIAPGLGTLTPSDDDTVFAYQLGVGGGWAVNEKVILDIKYRYFGTSDPEYGTIKVEYSSHNFYAGIRVGF